MTGDGWAEVHDQVGSASRGCHLAVDPRTIGRLEALLQVTPKVLAPVVLGCVDTMCELRLGV